MTTDNIIGTGVDTNKIAPLLRAVNTVVHDLASSKLSLLVKDLGWSSCIIDVGVIDTSLSDNTKSVLSNPFPETNWFFDIALLYFSFGIEIEDLDGGSLTLWSSQSNNISSSMHENTFSFHWLSFKLEVLCSINDSTIL